MPRLSRMGLGNGSEEPVVLRGNAGGQVRQSPSAGQQSCKSKINAEYKIMRVCPFQVVKSTAASSFLPLNSKKKKNIFSYKTKKKSTKNETLKRLTLIMQKIMNKETFFEIIAQETTKK